MSYIVAIKSLGRWKLLDRTLYPLGRQAQDKVNELNMNQHGEFKAFDADHEPGATILKNGVATTTEAITDVRSVVAGILHVSIKDKLTEETLSARDTEEMRTRYAYAKQQPHPFPFDNTPGGDTMVFTEGFRFFKQADYDFGTYLFCTGIEDPNDFVQLAQVITKARRWERIQAKRTAMGDETAIKPWTMDWKEDFMFCVTAYDQAGIDFFTGAWTDKPSLDKKSVN